MRWWQGEAKSESSPLGGIDPANPQGISYQVVPHKSEMVGMDMHSKLPARPRWKVGRDVIWAGAMELENNRDDNDLTTQDKVGQAKPIQGRGGHHSAWLNTRISRWGLRPLAGQAGAGED